MKKILLFAMILGAASVFAADSYLYWLPPDETMGLNGSYTAKVIAGGSSWAWDGDHGAGTYLNLYDGTGTSLGGTTATIALGAGADNGTFFANAANMDAGSTFYIELWNDGTLVGISEGLAYSSAGLGALQGMGTPGTLWQGMTFVTAPIPEPNSGLLMLIGCALLGLRRKQKKA